MNKKQILLFGAILLGGVTVGCKAKESQEVITTEVEDGEKIVKNEMSNKKIESINLKETGEIKDNQEIDLETVEEYERYFKGESNEKSLRYFGDKNNKKGYVYVEGTKPVIISFPHTIKQPSRGKYNDGYGYKGADTYTGSLAKIISEKTGAHIIYKTTYSEDDENYIDYTKKTTAYRTAVKDIANKNNVKAFIDVHGFSDKSKNKSIELGTGRGNNLLGDTDVINSVLKALEINEFTVNADSKENKVVIDEEFTGGGKKTMSSYTANVVGIPSIQIEIGKTYRNPEDMSRFNKMVKTLIDIIDAISNEDI